MDTDDYQASHRRQLQVAFDRSGMSYRDLWVGQLAIGGDASDLELEAYLLGLLKLSPHQYDVIAHALNEHYLENGQDHPVTYSDDKWSGRTG
jgi:hypothetical protein